ncbi:MAG: hypothetical protein MOB07_23090 [Acidobacteria bacterium]|nr:hypothetical protein [Acidobacteriota bacterium]
MCLDCLQKDMVANWGRRKLPDAPDNCEKCGASLAGNDVAMLWLGKALCGGCFDEVRKANPEINDFALMPLVDMGWMNELGATPNTLTVRNLQPVSEAVVEIDDADFCLQTEDADKYIH